MGKIITSLWITIPLAVIAYFLTILLVNIILEISNYAEFGDAIGGTLNPLLSIVSAIIIYKSISLQVEANKFLTEKQVEIKEHEQIIYIENQIKDLTLFMNSKIDSLKYGNKEGISTLIALNSKLMDNDELNDFDKILIDNIDSVFEVALSVSELMISKNQLKIKHLYLQFDSSYKMIRERIDLLTNKMLIEKYNNYDTKIRDNLNFYRAIQFANT